MKRIIDCSTGEITDRPLNDDELEQKTKDQAKCDAANLLLEQKAKTRQAALAKLTALGLTTDDLQSLGLGGN